MIDAADLFDGGAVDLQHDGAGPVLTVVPDIDRNHGELFGTPPQEAAVLPPDVVPATRSGPDGDFLGIGGVAHVEDRNLRTGDPAVEISIGTDPEHPAVTDRVEVAGEAGNLEFADDARVLGISEIEGVEGVDLAEGDDIADVADEANRLDSLAVTHVADAADLDQFAVGLAENPDKRLGAPIPGVAARGDDPEVAFVLAERELVAQIAGHGTRRGVGSASVAQGESMDRGVAGIPSLLPGVRVVFEDGDVGPRLGGDEDRVGRGVDGVARGEDTGGLGGVERAGDRNAHDREHTEAGELGGCVHRRAVGEDALAHDVA